MIVKLIMKISIKQIEAMPGIKECALIYGKRRAFNLIAAALLFGIFHRGHLLQG